MQPYYAMSLAPGRAGVGPLRPGPGRVRFFDPGRTSSVGGRSLVPPGHFLFLGMPHLRDLLRRSI